MHFASPVFAYVLPLLASQGLPPSATPAPAAEPEATPAPATPDAMTPQPTPPPADAVPANPRHWRVSKIEVPGATGTRQEFRVLRSDDTAVSLAEGLADIGDQKRVADRAARLDDSQNSWQSITGRIVVLCVGGALTAVGAVAAVAGAGFWAWSTTGATDTLPSQVSSLVLQGPSIMLTGLIAGAIGLFTVAVTAGLWAWFIIRGPAPADPAVVQALGASLGWAEAEANEVVSKHNTAVDQNPAPAPAAPVTPAR